MAQSGLPAVNREKMGVGATDALSLRVSVAVLVRVLFRHPQDGAWMLALERKATLYEGEGGSQVELRTQPFGGAVRIVDVGDLHSVIGTFNFDSPRSRAESDFRLFISPEAWPDLRALCLAHHSQDDDTVLDSDPGRELQEELFDTVRANLRVDQYICAPAGLVVQNAPQATDNPSARDWPTARIYRVFTAVITDPALGQALLAGSECITDREVRARAVQDAQSGGKGRANAILALPVEALTAFYQGLPLAVRNEPVEFEGHRLEETVPVVLEGVEILKYVRG